MPANINGTPLASNRPGGKRVERIAKRVRLPRADEPARIAVGGVPVSVVVESAGAEYVCRDGRGNVYRVGPDAFV